MGNILSMKDLIKKILKEEVNKKYSKPTAKIESLIYSWLNDYFSGSKIYHIKSYESSHTFEWCNHGKEILKVFLEFNYDDEVWDDKRKTEERDFEIGRLQVPKDIIDELESDIPVRRTYLRYIIEEWFDDTYLGEIQKMMERKDIFINVFFEHPIKAEKCVPPRTRDENVTMQDMIDYVLKNTLFTIKDLEKKSDEDIEKIYLEKLRNEDMDRLRRN